MTRALQDPSGTGQDPAVGVTGQEGHVLAHDVQDYVFEAKGSTYGEHQGTGRMVQEKSELGTVAFAWVVCEMNQHNVFL